MKILQLVTERQYRGAEVFAANLSAELIGFGHTVIFAGLYANTTDVLEVTGAKNIDLINHKKGDLSFQLIKRIVHLIREEKPDIVQCNGSDTLKYMVAASYFTSRRPIVYRNISVISEWINSPLKLHLYKFLFKRVDHVTSVGNESIRDLISTLNYPESRTSVIRRGIPITPIEKINFSFLKNELHLRDSDKIVMHIGNFSPEKNHDFLIDVFSEIKRNNSNIKLVCVGNGVTFNDIKKKIEDKNIGDTIFLLGFRKNIPDLLSQADCFVLSSLIEGVPGVILEAGAQKIPTVATNVGGVNEVLIDGETGFIVNNFNKVDFKSKIIQLLEGEQERKKMGEKAYDLVLKDFDPIKNSRKFESLYLELTGLKTMKNDLAPVNLKILHIIQKKQYRGAEVFTCQLSNQLISVGNEVEIISIFDGAANLNFQKPIRSLYRAEAQRIFDIKGWKKLSKIIKEFNPDIVQANASDTLKYAVFSKLFFNWKAILVYRNASSSSFYIRTTLSRILNSFLLRKVDLIISVSTPSMKDLNDLFPFTRSKSLVIPVGVDTNYSEQQVDNVIINKKAKYNILHIGSFTREKNHIGIINIFDKIHEIEPNTHLVLIGSGPLENEVRTIVKELNLLDKVSFLGEIQNPFPYLQMGDVLILPSIVEGLPGVILEAMLFNLPVVAYNVGGISEVLNEKSGYLISKHDEARFAETVLSVLQKENRELKDYARCFVINNFSNRDIMQRFLREYRNIIFNKES